MEKHLLLPQSRNCLRRRSSPSALIAGPLKRCSKPAGENAVVVCAKKADYIIGPIGIVIADSMYGEITAAMASAIGSSSAQRILIPVHHCDTTVVGVEDYAISHLAEAAIRTIVSLASPH